MSSGTLRWWLSEFMTSLMESMFEPDLQPVGTRGASDATVSASLRDLPCSAPGPHESVDNLGLSGELSVIVSEKQIIFEGSAGTVPYRIIAGVPSALQREEASKTLQATVQRVIGSIMKAVNPWGMESEASLMRTSSDTEKWWKLSEPLDAAFHVAASVGEISKGRFDVAHAAARAGLLGRPFAPPTSEDPQTAEVQAPSCLQQHFEWRSSAGSEGLELRKRWPHAGLDLCGVTKGMACADVVKALRAYGFFDVLCCWGGEVCVSGQHPDRRPWRLAIIRPPPLGMVFREWEEAAESGRPLWSRDCSLPVDTIHNVPHESESVLWHFAASGGWARPRKKGLTELLGREGPLELKSVPGVVVAVREFISDAAAAGTRQTWAHHCGALADALATAAAVVGEDEAPKLLEQAQEHFDLRGQLRFWVYPAESNASTVPVTEQNFLGAQLRALVRDEAARQLSLLACFSCGGLQLALNTTVLCASLEPPLLSFYTRRGSAMDRMLGEGSLLGVGFLQATHSELARWLEARGGSSALDCGGHFDNKNGGFFAEVGAFSTSALAAVSCRKRRAASAVHVQWPFFGWEALVPSGSEGGGRSWGGTPVCPRPVMSAADASGASAALAVESAGMALPPWLMVSVASRVVVGESALFVCNLLDVSSSGRERVSPLVRWTRQHQSLRNMSEGAST
mmetsp:Transcript_106685/g.340491  ORF Transcript_106685/g.340491 Transcript_106685/m.340491 type:complete len:683 (-) Transcript_106685:289-2337(-)|eukprot:CAMPEP_0203977546 /NCGR_PEP_ID=MMETSP0359-20131031/101670_1 /ASSEMBLY_ACC=CAM_ASM_000338 /TAXON_ID=268821 /ORGANISM="Scrippsiella Hangoei, Strain SHTV-5" /LENGTH=682 /DNA_ID=CAMNT_0050915755 /DNA_START=49 /DNA_END=2097 /DNA_ORIENTATION=+